MMTVKTVDMRNWPIVFLENLSKKLKKSLDLFNNPVGYRTSPCKMFRILLFSAEFAQKLKFLDKFIEKVLGATQYVV
jgi:hypothetical protein